MSALRKIGTGLGYTFSPLLFAASKSIRSKALCRLAALADPENLRALRETAMPGYSRQIVDQLILAGQLSTNVSADAGERIRKMLPNSESQLLQDIFCMTVLDGKRSGYFVEIGVGSGRSISNTFMLEKDLGWTGLLVEPNRSFHESIGESRTAILDKRAAASVSGEVLRFEEIVGAGEYSRLYSKRERQSASLGAIETYDVVTVALSDLLSQVRAPSQIDYLSLDTEGSEIDILKGIDFSKTKISVLTIEHNFEHKKLQQLDQMLLPLGYRRVLAGLSKFDAWYVHSELRSVSFAWN